MTLVRIAVLMCDCRKVLKIAIINLPECPVELTYPTELAGRYPNLLFK